MSPLDFFFGAVLVIIGYCFLGGAMRFADKLPLYAAIVFAMKQTRETLVDILGGIAVFSAILAMFILFGMIGSTLLAKGVLLFLPL